MDHADLGITAHAVEHSRTGSLVDHLSGRPHAHDMGLLSRSSAPLTEFEWHLFHTGAGFDTPDCMTCQVARFLLRVGYGTDFSYWDRPYYPITKRQRQGAQLLPPTPVLEAMVTLAAHDPDPELRQVWGDVSEDDVRWCLEQEIGEWSRG
jgi:hypothetical protein